MVARPGGSFIRFSVESHIAKNMAGVVTVRNSAMISDRVETQSELRFLDFAEIAPPPVETFPKERESRGEKILSIPGADHPPFLRLLPAACTRPAPFTLSASDGGAVFPNLFPPVQPPVARLFPRFWPYRTGGA